MCHDGYAPLGAIVLPPLQCSRTCYWISPMHGLRSVTEKILLFIDCIGNFGGTGTLLLIRAAGCHRAPHSRMVVQPAGDCSSSVLYRARLARRALRVPARGGCRRWWYSHPKHTGPCLSQRGALLAALVPSVGPADRSLAVLCCALPKKQLLRRHS